MADNEGETERLRRRLQELEIENAQLRETQERQDLGRELLTHLQRGGRGSDRVLRAVQAIQREYGELEASLRPRKQQETIDAVKKLRKKLSSAMTHRNVAGAVGIVALGAQIALNASPVGKAIAGVVAVGSNTYGMFKRSDIEKIWRRIQILLENDAERFRDLTRAVEALDDAWTGNFGYTIHSERFREICDSISQGQGAIQNNNNVAEAVAEISKNSKLYDALKWFAKDVVWKNIKLLLTTHYLYSIISIIAAFADNPIIECAVPGTFMACQIFLMVREIVYTDKQKMAEIDAGLERMRRQSEGMDELIRE